MSAHVDGANHSRRNRKKVVTPAAVPLLDERQMAEQWINRCIARAKRVGHFAEFFTVTPSMAEALLARNPNNRVIVESGVRLWANALRAGHWEPNGEPIIVAITGELNDGQHRLTAVVKTGIAMPVLVVFGVTRESRLTVDAGKKRTVGHVLGMAGVLNASLVGTSTKLHLNLRHGTHLHTHRSPKEVELELAAYPDLRVYRTASHNFARQYHQSAGLMAAIHCIAYRKHGDAADRFFELLDPGSGITDRTHPCYVLRKRLFENLGNKAKLPMPQVAALTIKSWNSFRLGRPVKSLRWTDDGDTPEPFPEID